jgi:hypothetical protein
MSEYYVYMFLWTTQQVSQEMLDYFAMKRQDPDPGENKVKIVIRVRGKLKNHGSNQDPELWIL